MSGLTEQQKVWGNSQDIANIDWDNISIVEAARQLCQIVWQTPEPMTESDKKVIDSVNGSAYAYGIPGMQEWDINEIINAENNSPRDNRKEFGEELKTFLGNYDPNDAKYQELYQTYFPGLMTIYGQYKASDGLIDETEEKQLSQEIKELERVFSETADKISKLNITIITDSLSSAQYQS